MMGPVCVGLRVYHAESVDQHFMFSTVPKFSFLAERSPLPTDAALADRNARSQDQLFT